MLLWWRCKGAAASRWVARLQSISEVLICSPIRATLTVIVMGTPSHYDVVITVIVIATMTTVWCGLFIYSIKRRWYLSLFIGWSLLVLLFCTRWYDIQKKKKNTIMITSVGTRTACETLWLTLKVHLLQGLKTNHLLIGLLCEKHQEDSVKVCHDEHLLPHKTSDSAQCSVESGEERSELRLEGTKSGYLYSLWHVILHTFANK